MWPMYVRNKSTKRIWILAEPTKDEDKCAWYFTIDKFGYTYRVSFTATDLKEGWIHAV